MKRRHGIFFPLVGMMVLASSGKALAGTLSVPHGQEDRVIVYTYKMQYAHPVDYWWHLNPSASGSWDYFSPIRSIQQPVPLEQGTLPTHGTPSPSVRKMVRHHFADGAVYGNPAVTGTPPAYQQVKY